ncbi:phosphatidylserine decarboxylase [Nakamurella sp.]|uniref:phosphatidylserine decarboxylase n=1 Tax=Nakamurella sp. TaxID=1869182 RepID=UPI003B3AC412
MADTRPGSHMVGLIRSTIPPIHPGGRPIVLGAAGATLAGRLLLRTLGLRRAGRVVTTVGLAAAAGSAAFFRAPARVGPDGTGLVVAPADGLVSLITDASPPPELGLPATPLVRVSIFLSIFDVHIQRVPIGGVIREVAYRPGAFLSADLDKASDDNERNSLLIDPADPSVAGPVVVTQIAGLVARRIVCDVRAGQPVATGDTYGLIRFGSRLDTYLPSGTRPLVRLGQRAVGGETVLADLAGTIGTAG